MLDIVAGFMSGLITVASVCAAAKFVIWAGRITAGRTGQVAAFAVALGFQIGHFPAIHAGPWTSDALSALGASLGGIAALIGLWFWLLRMPAEHDASRD